MPHGVGVYFPVEVDKSYEGQWWVSSLVEWLDEAGLRLKRKGGMPGVGDPSLPVVTRLMKLSDRVNFEALQRLSWVGIVLQGEGPMVGDGDNWDSLGLVELDAVMEPVEKGPLLLRVGQYCGNDKGRLVLEIMAIAGDSICVRKWSSCVAVAQVRVGAMLSSGEITVTVCVVHALRYGCRVVGLCVEEWVHWFKRRA